ncbi:MAG: ATP-binding cassette domain-containing protein [Mesorhizobium sp.]|nr:MAG: ATP-binding cassette domain-containing protein [Mesorhizobium sp.]
MVNADGTIVPDSLAQDGANAVLTVDNVFKRFGPLAVLDGVSLSVSRGAIHGLLGKNGAGKSTLSNIIAGLLRLDSGTILLNGEDVSALPLTARKKRGLHLLSQHSEIFEDLSIGENLLLPDLPRRYGLTDWPALRRSLADHPRRADRRPCGGRAAASAGMGREPHPTGHVFHLHLAPQRRGAPALFGIHGAARRQGDRQRQSGGAFGRGHGARHHRRRRRRIPPRPQGSWRGHRAQRAILFRRRPGRSCDRPRRDRRPRRPARRRAAGIDAGAGRPAANRGRCRPDRWPGSASRLAGAEPRLGHCLPHP